MIDDLDELVSDIARLTSRSAGDENPAVVGAKPEPGASVGAPKVEPLEGRLRRVEEELAERKALMDAIFHASYDGLCILDADGVFREMNAAFERITGLKRSEWLGR